MEEQALIEIKGLCVNFGEQEVLRDIDWFITPKSRVGLVGDNGAGKTTMLRLIAGIEEPSDGTIVMPKGHTVGYLPQDLVEIENVSLIDYLKKHAGLESLSIKLRKVEHELSLLSEDSSVLKKTLALHERLQREFEAKDGFSFEVKAVQVLRGLGFYPENDSIRLTSEFSGGWKMRIALAALLLSRSNILLLDEPTNHLDTESMEWLEGWLRDYKSTIITVSHDRRFLDKMITSVAELSAGKINIYSCGYEKYLTEREERIERLKAENEQQKGKIEDTQRFIERFRYKATKATQVQSRIKQLEKMEIIEVASTSKNIKFRFPEVPRSGLNVLTGNDISKAYGDKKVFEGLNFSIQRGERVALVGVNGAGKSTLLRILNQSEPPTKGEAKLGHNVKRSYFSQESAQNLDYDHTIWQEINNTGSKLLEGEKRKLLGAFLFSGDDIHKQVSILSGGEKSRVTLLKILLSKSNLLILDEPTNHLDYETKELFHKALLEYGGTILIVSHDRAFLDNLVDRVIEIRNGQLYNYPGNYSEFIEKREKQIKEKAEVKSGESETLVSEKGKEQKRAEAEERNSLYRERKKVKDKLKPLEKKIEEDEIRKEEISNMLCDAEVLSRSIEVQELMVELNEIENALKENYEKWEELVTELK